MSQKFPATKEFLGRFLKRKEKSPEEDKKVKITLTLSKDYYGDLIWKAEGKFNGVIYTRSSTGKGQALRRLKGDIASARKVEETIRAAKTEIHHV
jgi:hypothetical protein